MMIPFSGNERTPETTESSMDSSTEMEKTILTPESKIKVKLNDTDDLEFEIKKPENLTSESLLRSKYPEKISEVTAEDILPLLPQNLTYFYPLIKEIKNEKCQKQSIYFLEGLHNLTKWAVQSKFVFFFFFFFY
ncbi:hypothetical protein Phum_PHUM216870 [Pediculus humanus corporis]|uniref:Uncharacterized protein n=1 Tax=Pediculus humanus subsp. corporis TaxID=121224 RepID=E0VHW4_PEDHC|nr:uncharacterized protein Phum_PHUM216870 [Pediculus humanus corporis]EEB12970.1 hypothetical protein Phum_PHUM216870 [Pediculus humanus corporis]